MALISRATHILQWGGQRDAKPRGGANPNKPLLSSDCRLQFACMKLELVVIADQQTAVNTFSDLVQIKLRLPAIISISQITFRRREPSGKRVKVAVFSLQLKRPDKMTILRTTGEVVYKNFIGYLGSR